MNVSDEELYRCLERDTVTVHKKYWDKCRASGNDNTKCMSFLSMLSAPGVCDAFNPRRYRVYELKFMPYAIKESEYVNGDGNYVSTDFATARDWVYACRDMLWINPNSLHPSASEGNMYIALCRACGISQDERPTFEDDPHDLWGCHMSERCMASWRKFVDERVIPALETMRKDGKLTLNPWFVDVKNRVIVDG
jgi:hypothetical protein